jgi:preprotein translocase subunit SecA
MRKMGGDTIKSIAKRLLPAEELAKLELTQSQFTNSITRAQKQMEAYNFSIRKHLFEYDNVVNKQRMKIYGKRDEVLHWQPDNKDEILHEIAQFIHDVVTDSVKKREQAEQSNDELLETFAQIFGLDLREKLNNELDILKGEKLVSVISALLVEEWDTKTHIIADDFKLIQIIKSIFLQSIDKYWIEHIDTMHHLREKV